MNINERDLITIKVDLVTGLLHPPFTQLKERDACLETETLVKQHVLALKGPSNVTFKETYKEKLTKNLD